MNLWMKEKSKFLIRVWQMLGVVLALVAIPADAKSLFNPDGDKLRGRADHCKYEAEDEDGFEDGDGCPEADNDKDGFADGQDKCPNNSEDEDGFEDGDGCPEVDNDKDGFLDRDRTEHCPNQAETLNGFEDHDGCPDVAAQPGDGDDKQLPRNPVLQGKTYQVGIFPAGVSALNWEVDTSLPTPEQVCQNAARYIEQYPESGLRVIGLVSSEGANKKAQEKLATERASQFVRCLYDHGVTPDRIVAAYGDVSLCYDCTGGVSSRKWNRIIFVEFVDLKSDNSPVSSYLRRKTPVMLSTNLGSYTEEEGKKSQNEEAP